MTESSLKRISERTRPNSQKAWSCLILTIRGLPSRTISRHFEREVTGKQKASDDLSAMPSPSSDAFFTSRTQVSLQADESAKGKDEVNYTAHKVDRSPVDHRK